jgi:hypothetical protein
VTQSASAAFSSFSTNWCSACDTKFVLHLSNSIVEYHRTGAAPATKSVAGAAEQTAALIKLTNYQTFTQDEGNRPTAQYQDGGSATARGAHAAL